MQNTQSQSSIQAKKSWQGRRRDMAASKDELLKNAVIISLVKKGNNMTFFQPRQHIRAITRKTEFADLAIIESKKVATLLTTPKKLTKRHTAGHTTPPAEMRHFLRFAASLHVKTTTCAASQTACPGKNRNFAAVIY